MFPSTLLAYIVQFVRSSESMHPSNPNNEPDAPTEMVLRINKQDNMLPPIPDKRYSNPTRTVEQIKQLQGN